MIDFRNADSSSSTPPGVNVIGHITGAFGLGVYARYVIDFLLRAGYHVSAFDVDPGLNRKNTDKRHVNLLVENPSNLPYGVNIFIFGADAFGRIFHQYGKSLSMETRLNAGLVFWELPLIPPAWRPSLKKLDVILAPSAFIAQAFQQTCPGPYVIPFPIPIDVGNPSTKQRKHFDLQENGDLIFFGFDPLSDVERKNPMAVVEAFRRAKISPNEAQLVIKVNSHGHDVEHALRPIYRAAEGMRNVHYLKETLPYRDLLGLINLCDVYVSLHRAEGLGLGPFEAMALGKPVVATGWSGNLDFMSPSSACLVGYDLVGVDGALPVYKASTLREPVRWADPDVNEAALWLQELVRNPDRRMRIGQAAKAQIAKYNDQAAAGAALAELRALESLKREIPALFDVRKRNLGKTDWRVVSTGKSAMPQHAEVPGAGTPAMSSSPTRTGSKADIAVIAHLLSPDSVSRLESIIRKMPRSCALYLSMTESAASYLPRGALETLPLAAPPREYPDHILPAIPRLDYLRAIQPQSNGHDLYLFFCDFSPGADAKGDTNSRPIDASLHRILENAERSRDLVAHLKANPKIGAIVPRGQWASLKDDPLASLMIPFAEAMGTRVDTATQGFIAGETFWCRPAAVLPLLRLNLTPEMFQPTDGRSDNYAGLIQRLLSLAIGVAGLEVHDEHGSVLHSTPAAIAPWLPSHRWLPAERDWAAETVRAWQGAGIAIPRLHFAIIGSSGDTRMSRSLDRQWHPAGATRIPISGDVASVLRDVGQLLGTVDAEWVGAVIGNDRLADDAVFRITHALLTHPEWEIAYTDEDLSPEDERHGAPHFKPDFNLDYLRSTPYAGGLLVIKREALSRLGGIDPTTRSAWQYDLLLKICESPETGAAATPAIGHVPLVLLHRGEVLASLGESPSQVQAAHADALRAHFDRLKLDVEISPGPIAMTFRTRWRVPQLPPLVSVIVTAPSRLAPLKRCLDTLISNTAYPNCEVLVVHDAGIAPESARYLAALAASRHRPGLAMRVVVCGESDNGSALFNAAAKAATGEFLLLLNGNSAVLHADWLDEMVGHGARADVGVVGARLIGSDGGIRHAGLILGMQGTIGRIYAGKPFNTTSGYFGRAALTQNLSAVSSDCLLIRKALFEQIEGLRAIRYGPAFADADLCLRIARTGKRIVWAPFATVLIDADSSAGATQGGEQRNGERRQEVRQAAANLYSDWLPQLARDPAFNPNLTLLVNDVRIESQPALFAPRHWRPRLRVMGVAPGGGNSNVDRIDAAINALTRQGLIQGWTSGRAHSLPELARIAPDVMALRRLPLTSDELEWMEWVRQELGPLCVADLGGPLSAAEESLFDPDARRVATFDTWSSALRLCDRLIVPSQRLAEICGSLTNAGIAIIPDQIDGRRWMGLQPSRAPRALPRVGCVTSRFDEADLDLLEPVMRALRQEVEFVVIGSCPRSLQPYVGEIQPEAPSELLPRALCDLDLDVAVAPLRQTPRNEARSHGQLLEFGILGYPIVCSDVEPFRGSWPVQRVVNEVDAWISAIRNLIGDEALRRQAGDRLRQYVVDNWLVENNCTAWMAAWAVDGEHRSSEQQRAA